MIDSMIAPTTPPRPGPANSLVDVRGVRVGQVHRSTDGWRSGVTVVLLPPDGAVAAVDVAGGGPCTRETDMLAAGNLAEKVHAITLSGGSVFGLAAATGVVDWLADQDIGYRIGSAAGEVAPLVPGACLFDLGRGGRFRANPTAEMGWQACEAAGHEPFAQGAVGAGTGAVVGGLSGGVGTASVITTAGFTVAALTVVNASGSVVDPNTGELYATRFGLADEFAWLTRPASPVPVRIGKRYQRVPRNTTLGIVATDARLTRVQCGKVASVSHDGLARAIRPVHTLVDGDAIFAVSTGDRAPDHAEFHEILGLAGDVFTRAVEYAVLNASSWPDVPAYRDAFPGAVREGGPRDGDSGNA
jgi:L-aminopeptidase/D-esterase-like protein